MYWTKLFTLHAIKNAINKFDAHASLVQYIVPPAVYVGRIDVRRRTVDSFTGLPSGADGKRSTLNNSLRNVCRLIIIII